MKKFMILVIVAGCFMVNSIAQTTPSSTPLVIESMMLLPKRGMEEKFEAAVIAHNKKFHPDGPQVAGLRRTDYGPKTGWYSWVKGPVPYSSLDFEFSKESGHAQDWSTTVDPLVEEYGATNFLNFNNDLSFGWEIFKKSKHYELWSVDLQPKQYYRFKALIGKLKKAYESLGNTAFIVLENNLHFENGPDVVLIWSFNTYADWQKDEGIKATYEKQNGEGSWQPAMDEWMDIVKSYNSEIRSNLQ
jgi:hypothetical protein